MIFEGQKRPCSFKVSGSFLKIRLLGLSVKIIRKIYFFELRRFIPGNINRASIVHNNLLPLHRNDMVHVQDIRPPASAKLAESFEHFPEAPGRHSDLVLLRQKI